MCKFHIRGKKCKNKKICFNRFYRGGAFFSTISTLKTVKIVFFLPFLPGGRSFLFYHIRGKNGKN